MTRGWSVISCCGRCNTSHARLEGATPDGPVERIKPGGRQPQVEIVECVSSDFPKHTAAACRPPARQCQLARAELNKQRRVATAAAAERNKCALTDRTCSPTRPRAPAPPDCARGTGARGGGPGAAAAAAAAGADGGGRCGPRRPAAGAAGARLSGRRCQGRRCCSCRTGPSLLVELLV
jgi:hypothetical protein